MIKVTVFILAFFAFACTENTPQSIKKESAKAVLINNNPTFNSLERLEKVVVKAPYQLTFDVKRGKANMIDLIVKIDLEKGAYFASPFENEHMKGRLRFSLGEEKNVALTDLLTETPFAKTMEDLFYRGPANWVMQNTTYVQKLELKTKEDFEVFGNLKFVIEPKCTMEEIPFKIYVKDGKLGIEENPDC